MTFHWLDLVLVLGVGVSAVYATLRGFVRETLSIIAWVVAVLAALYFGPTLADALKPHLSGGLNDIAGYLLVFVSVLLLLSFVTFHLSGSVKRSPVGPIDRILGCLFGVLRGLAVAGIIYLVFAAVEPPPDQPDWMTKAELYPIIRKSGEMLDRLIPDRLLKHGITLPGHHATSAKAPAAATPPVVAAAPPAPSHTHKKSSARADDVASPRATPPETAEPVHEAVKHPAPKSEPVEKVKETTESSTHRTDNMAPMPRKRPSHSAEKQDKSATDATDTKHRKTSYGEKDREALDKLIEESGKRNSGKP